MRIRLFIARVGVWLLRPGLERFVDWHRIYVPLIHGPRERVTIHPPATVGGAILNTFSGSVTIAPNALFGQNVIVAAGTHNPELLGAQRIHDLPRSGHDVNVN